MSTRKSLKLVFLQLFALCFASGLSAAFASAAEGDPDVRDLDLRGSDCILIRTIRDYTPLDDRSLLIWGPAKRGYYVTLFRSALGLRSSFRLGFSSRDDRLCPYGGDAVVFDGVGDDKVTVQSISRVSAEQAEELLIRYGKKKPSEDKTPEPADVEGAEVEELD